ncbi:MAG: hypothetical protein DRP78_06495 [Candidatus Omnitrophota bacterium]|nr:MAG: hypothetical protein DRP78_06495 [Candidatus Omnitrophota bacterium]
MRFGNLHFLYLLLLIPVCAGFYIWAFHSKHKALEKFAQKELLGFLLQSVSFKKQKVKAVFFLLGVFFLVLALIQPKWGYHWEEVKRKGLDIMVVVDVSKSMLAEDIKPNRLQAAKREIKSLINILKGDRIGLIAFAGNAFLCCPLTLDYGTAKLFVDNLSVETIPLGGTNISAAIRNAIKAFEGHEKKHRVLILITDGEDQDSGVMLEAEEAKKHGVVIFTIGVGRRQGAPIPILDEQGRKTFVKDNAGNVVISKLDPVLLQKIALMTHGKKGSIGTGNFSLEKIYQNEVSKMEKKELKSLRQKRFENRFQIPLFISLMFFILEAVTTERRKQ